MAATHGGRITCDGADEYENPRTSVVISLPPQDSPQYFTFHEEHDGEDTNTSTSLTNIWTNNDYGNLNELKRFNCMLKKESHEARKTLTEAVPKLQKVIQYFRYMEKSYRAKFISEMLKAFCVTFLDDSHNQVDATCMVSSESEETLYDTIAKSGVQELQSHPCFAAVVNYKWNKRRHYKYIHWSSVFMHLLFMGCLLTALVLAARSGQPQEYSGAEGVIQGICEAISLLYIILWLVVTFLSWFSDCKKWVKALEKINYQRMWHFVTLHRCFDTCRILAVLLIIPTRLADTQWQWVFSSIAVICNGLIILHSCAVIKTIGPYVATLLILAKRDLPWIVAVFLILNISMGGGLYLSLQGINNAHSSSAAENSSEIYEVWTGGFLRATEGRSTHFDYPDWFAVIVYAVYIFTITIIFGSIVTAHFTSVYATAKKQAVIYVMLNKCAIMEKMDALFSFCSKHSTAMQNIGECKEIPTPYTYAGADSRPASELLVELRHKQLMEHITNMVKTQLRPPAFTPHYSP